MTYSIVARDPDTGEMGVAVQSHYFSVGSIVTWAEAGVGVVATQSLVLASYGPLGLDKMRQGKSAGQGLDELVEADTGRAGRQVAFVDASGEVAAHTGEGCIAEAGHVTGKEFSAQANMMARDTVWHAMAEAFTAGEGDLTERLVLALEAAEAEGGDIRGRQSAAILVVTGDPTGESWTDRLFDIRIEDHPEPIEELRRLVTLRRAYRHMDAGDEAMGKGEMEKALAAFGYAEELAPDIVEMPFWKAVGLAGTGNLDEAARTFAEVFRREPVWRQLLPRVVDAGLLDVDEDYLNRLLA